MLSMLHFHDCKNIRPGGIVIPDNASQCSLTNFSGRVEANGRLEQAAFPMRVSALRLKEVLHEFPTSWPKP
jgi:hypothetical protein